MQRARGGRDRSARLGQHLRGADLAITRRGWIPRSSTSGWRIKAAPISAAGRRSARVWHAPEGEVTIAVVGKYTGLQDAYKSLDEALSHGGIDNRVRVNTRWLAPRSSIRWRRPAPAGRERHPGPGRLRRARRGRQGRGGDLRPRAPHPVLRDLLGMQMAVVETARNLAGIEGASSTEFGPSDEPVVGLLTEWEREGRIETRPPAATSAARCALAPIPASWSPGASRRPSMIRTRSASGTHRYEVNINYVNRLSAAGLRSRACRPTPPARDRGAARPSLVRRRAVPPGAEVEAVRAASAVRLVHQGGARPVAAGVR